MGAACAEGAFQAGLEAREARLDAKRLSAPAYHSVRPGETLSEIANRYGVDVRRLASANNLRVTDRVPVGRRLEIPITRIVHRVAPGETLDEIADRYRVRVSTIAYLNRMGISRRVEVGQRLVIPRRRPTPDRVAASPPSNAVSAGPRAAVAAEPKRPAPATPRVDTETQDRIARARFLVDRGVADYRAARFEAAIERTREAEHELLDLRNRSDVRRLSARAAFVAGSAQAARGETGRATESFQRVHALDPGFEPPEGWLSPRLEALFADARPD
jgi:LysM repeat protein